MLLLSYFLFVVMMKTKEFKGLNRFSLSLDQLKISNVSLSFGHDHESPLTSYKTYNNLPIAKFNEKLAIKVKKVFYLKKKKSKLLGRSMLIRHSRIRYLSPFQDALFL